jgi:thiamine biosynthesis lipoprotein
VGSSHIDVGWRRIHLQRDGMRVTLDGIAKGFIVDGIAETLERHGIRRYLINAGGDIRSRRTKEDGQPWEVAVQDPDGQPAFADTIPLTSGAVATSGSYVIHFDPDQAFHHIVDARIGDSPRHTASVSVVAPTAMAADALATSIFVLGPHNGIDLVERLRGCACLVLDRTGCRWASSRWQGTRSTHERESVQ